MTSIKGVLFLKNVDGEMKWGNGDSGNGDSGNEDSGNEDSGNEGKYEGEIENWKPNGIGNITYLIGIKYVGEWKDGETKRSWYCHFTLLEVCRGMERE